MLPHLVRRSAALGFLGAFLLVVQAATAGHGAMCSVSQSTYVVDAYPDVTMSTNVGSQWPATFDVDVPAGYDIAHASAATSPITPVPDDEDVVGSGTATAKWLHLFCATGNVNLTLTWETTWVSPTPSGAVAMIEMGALGGLFNSYVFVVKQGEHDYLLSVPNLPSSTVCSSTTNGSLQLTIDGSVPGSSPARRVIQNPATPGDYTWVFSYTDTSGGYHSCSATVTITN